MLHCCVGGQALRAKSGALLRGNALSVGNPKERMSTHDEILVHHKRAARHECILRYAQHDTSVSWCPRGHHSPLHLCCRGQQDTHSKTRACSKDMRHEHAAKTCGKHAPAASRVTARSYPTHHAPIQCNSTRLSNASTPIGYNFGFIEIEHSSSDKAAPPVVWASAVDMDGTEQLRFHLPSDPTRALRDAVAAFDEQVPLSSSSPSFLSLSSPLRSSPFLLPFPSPSWRVR